MNYADTLDYLYTKLPMFSRMGSAAFRKDLTNIRILCDSLNNPQNNFKTIHVAGTNGKGSVSHMLAAVLQSEGYKTGLYTSPHLYDFRERIKLNGVMVSEEFVIHFVDIIKPLITAIEPSFFEITVAMAFSWFSEMNCETAVIEVGLGGRLDSTNIIQPLLSVITNIGWDHMNMLGNSLQEIAAEKAGIIKPNTPVLVGERQKEVSDVFYKMASEKQAPLYYSDDFLKVISHSVVSEKMDVTTLEKHTNKHRDYTLDLPGIYQLKNLPTVISACKILREQNIAISDRALEEGVEHAREITGLHGRWECIHKDPPVILEVAHNINGMQELLSHLKETRFNHLHVVIGMVRDKEIDPVLKLLPADATYYFTNAKIPRALEAVKLKQKAGAFRLQGDVYDEVNAALKAAISNAATNDLIIVCGSIFLVAEVNKHFL
jgi:dihydrofolate synthase / folylpolyglutamate synthase